MAEPLDAFVAADDQADGQRADALECRGDARLDVDVALARPPRRDGILERAGDVPTELREPLLLGGQ